MNPELQKQFNARELTAIRKYLRLRRVAQRKAAKQKKELLWTSTARDYDQVGAEIEKKEYNQIKCVCGHGIYYTGKVWFHENIDKFGNGDLDIQCQFCKCHKPKKKELKE